jgi:large subunit ribosomal protein L25
MEKVVIKANKRKIFGRKVKALRHKGLVPANVYGKKITSEAIEVPAKEFTTVFHKVGETGLIRLIVEDKEHPVLIHNVQIHPISREFLHIDFLEVNLKEKVTTKVPIVIIGEAPAVKDKVGVLLSIISELEVEALPEDLVEKIEVDISKLSAMDQVIKIKDIKITEKIKVLNDENDDIVKIAPLVSKEAEKMAKEDAEKAAAASAASTAASTGVGSTGDQPTSSTTSGGTAPAKTTE